MTEEVLTVREVAARLKVHPETVRDWLRIGRIKGSRLGGMKTGWRVRVSEIDKLLTATERHIAPEEGE